MSLSWNSVQLAGNLTRDPEVRMVGENSVANFGLAINSSYKTKSGEKVEDVTFIEVECWRKTAELVGQYWTKGKPIFLSGKLKMDSWEDKKTGEKRSKMKVVAEDVRFVESAGSISPAPMGQVAGMAAQANQSTTNPPRSAMNTVDDEPPF